jgi:uncharacterized membrane protein YdjX (TVP38/TMEM64 family)
MARKEIKKWIAAVVGIALLSGLCLFLWRTDLLERLQDTAALRDYLSDQAPWSQLIFFGLQLCSVIIAPIPSNLVAATGGAFFGTWQGFLITILAVTIGSCTTFWLARTLGKNFADRIVRKKLPAHYLELLDRKRDSFLILAFLFPFFPDDLLCIMAGLTDIPFRRFFFIVLFARPWGLLIASAFGGSLCGFSLKSLPILLLCGALFLIGLIYGDRMGQAVLKFLKRK